ncbi:MAG: hypothetical protein AB1750_20080 [Chloroflexota bacterium]
MKTVHHYSTFTKFQFWLYNLAAYIFLAMGLFVCLRSAIQAEIGQVFTGLGVIFFGLLFLFVAHFYSEIIADDEGLLVQFCFWHLRVRWDDVIKMELTTKNLLMYNILAGLLSAHYVVKTRALTPFHRFYGLYVSSFQPSFMFHSSISSLDDLQSSIKNNKFVGKSEKLAV